MAETKKTASTAAQSGPTAIDKAKLQPGQRVTYCGKTATVVRSSRNGLTLRFWGEGLKADEPVTRRVSHRRIEA